MPRLTLLLAITLAGCSSSISVPHVSGTATTQALAGKFHEIGIGPLNGWNLDVKADGSGVVGYGDGDYGPFPAGTLDFDEMIRVLEKEPIKPGYVGTPGTNYGFDWPDLPQGTRRHLRDRKLVLPWVKKAFDAIPSRPKRMDEIWKEYPPSETTNDIAEGVQE